MIIFYNRTHFNGLNYSTVCKVVSIYSILTPTFKCCLYVKASVIIKQYHNTLNNMCVWVGGIANNEYFSSVLLLLKFRKKDFK